MKPRINRKLWLVVTVGAALCAGWQVHAESNRVSFPDLAQLVHYTIVTAS